MKLIENSPEEGQSATATLMQYAEMARRQRWLILGTLAAALLGGWIYIQLAPKLYRSEALILAEDPKVSEMFVQGVSEGKVEQRIFLIKREISNRDFLRELIKEFDLYHEVVAIEGIDLGISMLADSIVVEMVGRDPRENFMSRSGLDAFTVSVVHSDPKVAMQLTNRIAGRFVEENMKAREEAAQGTSEFLDAEVLRAQHELELKEDEISRYKTEHMGHLPQQMEANLRALDRLPNDLNTVNENTQRLTDRLATVEKGIREYQRFGRTNPGLSSGAGQPDPLIRRLAELREKLVKLKAEFWDEYPEVQLTMEELRQVEKQLVETYGPDFLKPGESPPDPYLQDLAKQQSELKSELALLRQRHQSLLAERAEYQKRIEKSPEVEQELLILERDYDNMKNNYRSLLDKRLNARVAENLEKRKKGGQFRILDAASFPRTPVTPNQPRIMILAFLLGCVFGVGGAAIREQLNPQFQRPEELELILGPQLLAAIPDFTLEFNRISWRRFFPGKRMLPGTAEGDEEDLQDLLIDKRLVAQSGDNSALLNGFVVKWLPNSSVAEQYRVAATRLSLIRPGGQSTVVAVTSAVKGEGKTTTVVNLGYTMARDLGKRTLLLDCDFKFPMLHRYAEAVPKVGLADCLVREIPLENCIYSFEEAPCSIMPVGSSAVTSTELLRTDRLGGIIAQLRERFEYILINTPPIFPLAAMNVLARHADLLVLVVRANSTPKPVVQRALGFLQAIAPAHVILNAVKSHSLPSYMGDYEYLHLREEKQSAV